MKIWKCRGSKAWTRVSFEGSKVRKFGGPKTRKFSESKVWPRENFGIQKIENWEAWSFEISRTRGVKNSKVRGFQKNFNIWKFERLIILLLRCTIQISVSMKLRNWCLAVCTNYVDVNRKTLLRARAEPQNSRTKHGCSRGRAFSRSKEVEKFWSGVGVWIPKASNWV